MASAKDVDAYLAKVPEDARATLEQVRQTIRRLAPTAIEVISYGVPAFKYKGRGLAGYAAYKNHCSYFPMSSGVIRTLEKDLVSFQTSKGTLQFPIGEPLSADLIEKLLNARIAEIEEARRE